MCSIHRGEACGLSMNLVGPKWVPGASADSWGVFWGDEQRKNKGSANAARLPRRHSLPRTPRGYHERSRTKPKSNLHLLLARHIWREHAFFLCFGVPPGFYCPCKHLCLDPVPERRGYLVGGLVLWQAAVSLLTLLRTQLGQLCQRIAVSEEVFHRRFVVWLCMGKALFPPVRLAPLKC